MSGQIDALGLERLTRMSIDELEAVTHVAPPKELPLVILKDAVKLLNLPPGGVGAQGATEALVQSVATRCNEWADRIVKARAALTDGINVWGAQIVEHQAERAAALKALEDVVNNLKARNTVGKLNKVDLTKEQLTKAAGGNKVLEWVEDALAADAHINDVVATCVRRLTSSVPTIRPASTPTRSVARCSSSSVPTSRPTPQRWPHSRPRQRTCDGASPTRGRSAST